MLNHSIKRCYGPECEDVVCTGRYWWLFLASSLVTLAVGTGLVFLVRFITRLPCLNRRRHHVAGPDGSGCCAGICPINLLEKNAEAEIHSIEAAKDWATRLLSAQSRFGRILLITYFCISMASYAIYVIDTGKPIERCLPADRGDLLFFIDNIFNFFFLGVFIFRFISWNDKFWFWFSVNTLVDIFTIPPTFVSLIISRTWLGLRCLRIMILMQLPEILQLLRVLRTSNGIKLTSLLTIVAGAWLTSAGIYHLVENSGDPWINFNNSQSLTYGQCIYITVVTMSTVGYGDLTPKTTCGTIFIIFFILGVLAIFASALPEIVEIVGKGNKYSGVYEPVKGKKHIVVCGHITYDSVSNFLKDFLHIDRDVVNVNIVLLDTTDPDLELQALFRRHFTKMRYFQGSVFNPSDLQRVKLNESDACLILCNKYSPRPDTEDSGQIMRVISIKNFNPEMRVIVQLIQDHSKTHLLNIPSWNQAYGDDVICIAALKLGFIAQTCLAPGFSTMMANLFAMRSSSEIHVKVVKDDPTERVVETQSVVKNASSPAETYLSPEGWMSHYLHGCGNEIYTESLSRAFDGMTAPEMVKECFIKLKLLLIAVQQNNEFDETEIIINPGPYITINQGTVGFFLAPDATEAKRAYYYCRACHSEGVEVEKIWKCECKECESLDNNHAKKYTHKDGHKLLAMTRLGDHHEPAPARSPSAELAELKIQGVNLSESSDHDRPAYDFTGLFHWTPARTVEDALITSAQKRRYLVNHIIVCLFGDESSPLIGLRNFVMPLRASNFKYEDLRTIVFLGNIKYIEREWDKIMNFPKVFIYNGSPLSRADMCNVNVHQSAMCVILSANLGDSVEQGLQDKETILSSLNLKSIMAAGAHSRRSKIIAAYAAESPTRLNGGSIKRSLSTQGTPKITVPMITELVNDVNVQFLDDDDEDDPDTELYLTQPFACGTAFAVSVLDSLMSATYFNAHSLTLIRTMITGGTNADLEEILAEGGELPPGVQISRTRLKELLRDRCTVAQLSIGTGVFQQFKEGAAYGSLFLHALESGILCLGIYRNLIIAGKSSSKRYVITNPPQDFDILAGDRIFCLKHFEDLNMNKEIPETALIGSDL
ncbi:calcium-activated potassium channel subunit alpha-1-like isoform X2 [Acanthaster planci]|uniref:BK channel n=1 Tax=Acanthaster planci TaxID=133434 RepID=A0A8B8A6X3_ACAPL|nr:calcium-activated potassium channel subunit alpha-1-like isoform X2 [Acanthaster planci]